MDGEGKGTSFRRQRALPRDARGEAARHCARSDERETLVARGVAWYISPVLYRGDGFWLRRVHTDRRSEMSRGVRAEPRHDTEDLCDPRRLGAFLKREERETREKARRRRGDRGRRLVEGEGETGGRQDRGRGRILSVID